ncbi:adenylate/guanylate cyclase domain-containing protein [Jiella sonneratiae]|uniref:Adenylate/guanylate cyclase domain-containing protein n=1 Tax=Jiella sonneratiae TaxID=2816856 RepID=A0ABS3JA53_9HYPH|nr:adenylate/guanylate cyclase domain-containing protein [Jiella sonneratiae]MBO0906007.1 adenylate/guanylate cyclase domain-containing protein [Jiella sonneratiae]
MMQSTGDRLWRNAGTLRLLRRKIPPRLREPLRWRQATGMVLFAYAATHLANHALGNISSEALGFGAWLKRLVWDNPVGTLLLYGALVIHVGLALHSLATRHSWRLPATQVVQIATGLSIPILLFPHIVSTRGAEVLFGETVGYSRLLHAIWPAGALLQTVFLCFVWVHGCLGMRQWLQNRSDYQRLAPTFAILATALLVFAFTGFVTAGRVAARRTDIAAIPPEVAAAAQTVQTVVLVSLSGIFGLMLLWPYLGGGRRIVLRYDNGDGTARSVTAPKGSSVLEVSRSADIAHASACNGRARCSTCRVLVLRGHDLVADAPNAAERLLLQKIKAPPNVRLGCQYRPSRDVTLRRMVGAGEIYDVADLADPYRFGVEREVVALFADLRGFTGISERWLPYDVVHLLNAYFDRVARQIEANRGEIDKFMGDGVMALFHRKNDLASAARDALTAALEILRTVEAMNEENRDSWQVPLQVAIGIHGGSAILGQIGGGGQARPARTALGRTINAASRLQDFAKTLDVALVVSDDVARLAGIGESDELMRVVAELRGSTRSLEVTVFSDLDAVERAVSQAWGEADDVRPAAPGLGRLLTRG